MPASARSPGQPRAHRTKLHLFGASGTGVSTLGEALSPALGLPYFDTNAYFWQASDPPFTQPRPPTVRDARLALGLARHKSWVLGGSLVGWDEKWLTAFDLVVFLWLPPALRRQHQREHARYGPQLTTDPSQAARTQAFLDWAAGCDDSSTGGTRTLATHARWLTQCSCPVPELHGDLPAAARLAAGRTRLCKLGLA